MSTSRGDTSHRSGPTRVPTPFPLLDVVGLTPCLLAHLPAEHGVVGNGWHFRELGDVLLWRQHHGLVAGDKLWDAALRAHPGCTVANICWRYAMGADTDYSVTPAPIHYSDGRKEPDCYTRPPAPHDELTAKLGTFPLFHFWGPGADLVSSRWIIDAARHILRTRHPDLTLCHLPHLDHDLQRYGPDDPRAQRAATDLDAALAPLLDEARAEGRTVVALSEYGITPVSRPVDITRVLRRPEDLAATRAALTDVTGGGQLLDDEGKKAHHLDHPRSGELVAVAEPDAWFTYDYWQEARAALPHGGLAPGPLTYSGQPRPPARERRRRSAPHLLHPPVPSATASRPPTSSHSGSTSPVSPDRSPVKHSPLTTPPDPEEFQA